MTPVPRIAHKGQIVKGDKGFTLIELMISMVLGMFVVGVTIAIYVMAVKGSSDTMKSVRLNHDLESVMHLIVNDLRRSGYWGGAIAGSKATDNPFMTATTRLQIPNSTCILYAYDADGGDDVDANEYYGFRLDGTTIRMRHSGSTTADCTDGNWEEVVDGDNVEITGLDFQFQNSCLNASDFTASYDNTSCAAAGSSGDNMLERRIVTLSISGRLADDSSVRKTLTDEVTVRNDYLYQLP